MEWFRKQWFIALNLALALVIVVLLFTRRNGKPIEQSCDYGADARAVGEILDRYFSHQRKPFAMVFLFNEAPNERQLEITEKMAKRYREKADVLAVFRGRADKAPNLPFHGVFSTGRKIIGRTSTRTWDGNYYLVLKQDRILYADNNFSISSLIFPTEWNIRQSQPPLWSGEEFKKAVIGRIQAGSIHFSDVRGRRVVRSGEIPDGSKIYLIHGIFASCDWTRIPRRLSGPRAGTEREILLFSYWMSQYDVQTVMTMFPAETSIWFDEDDTLGLGAIRPPNRKGVTEILYFSKECVL